MSFILDGFKYTIIKIEMSHQIPFSIVYNQPSKMKLVKICFDNFSSSDRSQTNQILI